MCSPPSLETALRVAIQKHCHYRVLVCLLYVFLPCVDNSQVYPTVQEAERWDYAFPTCPSGGRTGHVGDLRLGQKEQDQRALEHTEWVGGVNATAMRYMHQEKIAQNNGVRS